ncbi:hypothetical protein CHS0354_009274 [Potamilus streckersoni]|uniref:Uncharacterized protein n=1 Tax=Potamilus streckersoni TaxID=2493646 RepID=A0AAE0W773_9BIVA|nr:hypothetical protein CHS0354_009274 [Potamilus streckersoni]
MNKYSIQMGQTSIYSDGMNKYQINSTSNYSEKKSKKKTNQKDAVQLSNQEHKYLMRREKPGIYIEGIPLSNQQPLYQIRQRDTTSIHQINITRIKLKVSNS